MRLPAGQAPCVFSFQCALDVQEGVHVRERPVPSASRSKLRARAPVSGGNSDGSGNSSAGLVRVLPGPDVVPTRVCTGASPPCRRRPVPRGRTPGAPSRAPRRWRGAESWGDPRGHDRGRGAGARGWTGRGGGNRTCSGPAAGPRLGLPARRARGSLPAALFCDAFFWETFPAASAGLRLKVTFTARPEAHRAVTRPDVGALRPTSGCRRRASRPWGQRSGGRGQTCPSALRDAFAGANSVFYSGGRVASQKESELRSQTRFRINVTALLSLIKSAKASLGDFVWKSGIGVSDPIRLSEKCAQAPCYIPLGLARSLRPPETREAFSILVLRPTVSR